MIDKRSVNYVKSSYREELYGDEKSTTYERELKVSGKDPSRVGVTGQWIKNKVMP